MGSLAGWQYRIPLVIDNTNVDSNQSSFPVMIYISAASGIGGVDVSTVFDRLTADGNRKKIAVTSSDGTTELKVEIELWDDANERAVLHVNVPTVNSGSTTTLYLYYDVTHADNANVGDTTDAVTHDVWDGNHLSVYHMAQNPNGDPVNGMKDSTVNQDDGSPGGSMTTADLVDSQVGKGIDFDAINDHIDIANGASPGVGVFTLMILFKTNNNYSGADGFLYSNYGLGLTESVQLSINASNFPLARFKDSNGDSVDPVGDEVVNDNIYHLLTLVRTSQTAATLYLDDGTTSWSDSNVSLNDVDVSDGPAPQIARLTSFDTNLFADIIDEVRISDTNRGADYIKVTWHNLKDTLITFGTEEEALLGIIAESFSADDAVLGFNMTQRIDESFSADDALTRQMTWENADLDESLTVDDAMAAWNMTARIAESFGIDDTWFRDTGFVIDRNRFNQNITGQHISIKFQHNDLDQIVYLEDLGLGIGVFPKVWGQDQVNMNLTSNHISLKLQHDTLDEILYLQTVGFDIFTHAQR